MGFVKDLRRMNVAITRARFVLIVLGNSETLAGNDFWLQFIESFNQKKRCVSLENESMIPEFIDNLFHYPNLKLPK
jgi:superfamily I DNA and/or RNA helicase